MKGSRKMQKVKTHNATIPSLSSRRQDGIENVLTDGLVDALGRIVADKQREFETELQKAIEREVRTVTAELRQALAEMRAEAMDRKAKLDEVTDAARLDVDRILTTFIDGELERDEKSEERYKSLSDDLHGVVSDKILNGLEIVKT